MHIARSAFVTACLSISIIPTVSAFYPYTPTYPTDNSNTNAQRRALHTATEQIQEDRRSITLPIRRVPTRRENKYTIVKSKDPTQKNSVAIDQDGPDYSYMVAVTIGSSSEEYHLLLDSAASNTWVMAETCETKACASHNTFGEGDSDSLKIDETSFAISFGTGSVSGNIGTDTLHIASLSPTLSFGLATNVSEEFGSYPMDGILGIGRGDNVPGTIEHPSLMDVLSTSKLIPAKVYGIHLSRGKDGLQDGELNLGTPNTDRYDGDLHYNPTLANDNGFWEIAIADAGFDAKTLSLIGRSAILDSGTSYILMPESDAVALHALIPGSTHSDETFTVPCSTTAPVQLKFGDQTYNISTKDYIGRDLGNGACASNIVGRQTFGDTQWLVGDVFLKNVYAVFDSDNEQVGFGVKKDSVSSTVSSPGVPTSTASATEGKGSATPNPILPADKTADPTAAALASPSSTQDAKGGAGRAAAKGSSFALLVALGLLSVFV